MSMINFILSLVEPEKSFIFLRPGLEVIKLEYKLRLTCPQTANQCALFWVWELTQALKPRGLIANPKLRYVVTWPLLKNALRE